MAISVAAYYSPSAVDTVQVAAAVVVGTAPVAVVLVLVTVTAVVLAAAAPTSLCEIQASASLP